ncbi:Uncharacterised protein [Enterobacter hormaechei]|nr:Uncharacterised protein [Enterobacter hormaechei]
MINNPTLSKLVALLTTFTCFISLYIYGNNHNWALTLILLIIPLLCGGIIFFFSHNIYSEVLKKSVESLLSLFSLISYAYYIYCISNINSNLTFANIFSSVWGYLFLTMVSLSGVIKLFISLKEFSNEYGKLAAPANNEDPVICVKEKQDEHTYISIHSLDSKDIYALIEKDNKIEISIKK